MEPGALTTPMMQAIAVLAVVSIVAFVASLVAVPWVLARLPADYFVAEKREPTLLQNAHPILRVLFLVLKNAIGATFLVGGIAMLVLPGQGILTILLGVSLLDFPGKYALQRRLFRRRPVHRGVNWIRRRTGKAPMVVPDADDGDEPGRTR